MKGELIWRPSPMSVKNSLMYKYMNWLNKNKGLNFADYNDLWSWSVDNTEEFWSTIWTFSGVKASRQYDKVLDNKSMPYTNWFTGSLLNYTENIFSKNQGNKTAIYYHSEINNKIKVSWNELERKVASLGSELRALGVKPGDRVVSYMPNIPETIIAFLATASIGAIWSSCSPDFGIKSVVDRFKQIEPVVLFTVDGYQYNGKFYDITKSVKQLQNELKSSLNHTVLVRGHNNIEISEKIKDVILWDALLTKNSPSIFKSVPFNHPLWIVFSSGTTGPPKPIVHGHGGILIEQLKFILLHKNLTPNDRFLQFTTTGWMMWNMLVGGLLAGSSIILYDGSPSYPNSEVLWGLLEEMEVTYFGTSASFLVNSLKSGIKPKEKYNLSKLKSIDSTGSPLSQAGYRWVYEFVNEDIWLSSSSGGTDVCTSFVGGIPILPVREGEIQGRCLGVNAQAYNEAGNPVINEVGELVVTNPMPSMPLYFWNDYSNEKYFNSYFNTYPNTWKHGDWIKFNNKGNCVIYGRSDSTINKNGVRAGTSDIYRVVDALDIIMESLVIDLEFLNNETLLILFIVLKRGYHLDDRIEEKIKNQIKVQFSPRFKPDKIYQVNQIPKTLNGKKMEVPIRKLLLGFDIDEAMNVDSVSNPDSLSFFINLSEKLKSKKKKYFF